MKLDNALKGTIGTLATVGVPALGGKLAADAAKAFMPNAVGKLPNPVVDAAGGAVAAALTIGACFLLGGKAAAARAVPFAVAGAALGVALPFWDTLIDSTVKSISGVSSAAAAAAALPAAAPGGLRALPGGQVRNGSLGGTLPGGQVRNGSLGGTLPGGREGISSVRAFSNGRNNTLPGGGMY